MPVKSSRHRWFSLIAMLIWATSLIVSQPIPAMAEDPEINLPRITQAGRLALVETLLEDPRPDRYRSDFMVTVLFADLLPPAHLDNLLNDRIELYRSFIDKIEARQGERSPGQEFVNGLGLTVYQAALNYIEEHGPWLVTQSLKAQGEAAE